MRNLILITGTILIALNTISVFILPYYPLLNYAFTDLSILSSTFLIYLLFQKANADAFKISLAFLFSFLGLVKIGLSLSVFQPLMNVFYLLGILMIIAFEILLLFLTKYMRKHV